MFSSSAEIFFVERTDDFRVVVVAGMNEQKKNLRSHCLLDSVITVYYCFPSIVEVPIVKLNDTLHQTILFHRLGYNVSSKTTSVCDRLFHRRYERIR